MKIMEIKKMLISLTNKSTKPETMLKRTPMSSEGDVKPASVHPNEREKKPAQRT